jgi:hypothetical protein
MTRIAARTTPKVLAPRPVEGAVGCRLRDGARPHGAAAHALGRRSMGRARALGAAAVGGLEVGGVFADATGTSGVERQVGAIRGPGWLRC